MIFITRLIRGNIKKKAVATRCAISLRVLGTQDCLGDRERMIRFARVYDPKSLSLAALRLRPPDRSTWSSRGSRHRIRDKSGWPTDLCLSCRIIARGSRETAPADRLRQETDFCGQTCGLSNVVEMYVIKSFFAIKVHAEKHLSFNSFTILNWLCTGTG